MKTDNKLSIIDRFFNGYLIIEIRGYSLERFINQIISLGIELWDLKRIRKDYYIVKIKANQFNLLRPLVKRRKCWIKILNRKGMPFLYQRLKKRYFLLFGLLIFLLIFYFGSSFLWFIKIEGLDKIPTENIFLILSKSGVKQGILKKRVDTSSLENILIKEESRIAWVDVKWQGTQLYINIVEKELLNKINYGDLISAKDGVISKLIVLQGDAVVREGDPVCCDQLLILKDENEKAKGIVKGYVWYEAYGEYQLVINRLIYTGEKTTCWGIKYGDKIIHIFPKKIIYDYYQREREIKTITKWRNIKFPLELIKEDYFEVEYFQEQKTREAALFYAKEEAMGKLLSKITSDAVIYDITVEEVESFSYNKVKVRLLCKTEENLAILKDR